MATVMHADRRWQGANSASCLIWIVIGSGRHLRCELLPLIREKCISRIGILKALNGRTPCTDKAGSFAGADQAESCPNWSANIARFADCAFFRCLRSGEGRHHRTVYTDQWFDVFPACGDFTGEATDP